MATYKGLINRSITINITSFAATLSTLLIPYY
jgi:hypothetical protein